MNKNLYSTLMIVLMFILLNYGITHPGDYLDIKRIAYENIIADAYGIPNEFQASLQADHTQLINTQVQYGYLDTIPKIGFYTDTYPFRTRIALIQLPEKNLLDHDMLPNTIAKKIKQSTQLSATILISGMLSDQSTHNINNMAFHPWGYSFLTLAGKQTYDITMQMGLFPLSNNSISHAGSNSIAIKKISSQNVNPHNGNEQLAFSPNNAQFLLNPSQRIFSFWSAAFYQSYSNITLHLIVNSKILEQQLSAIAQAAETIRQLLGNLTALNLDNRNDQTALNSFITSINQLLANAPREIKPDVDKLASLLNNLTTHLEKLERTIL